MIELIFRIMKRFARFRGPKGEHFSRVFLQELLMGKISEAWQREIAARARLQGLLDVANQRTAQGSISTPGGYILDSADLRTLDEMAGTVPVDSGVPLPEPAAPPSA